MLEVLFSLLGGLALVLLPICFLRFAAQADHGLLFAVLALLSFFAFLGSLYLAFSFWLFGFFPIFLISAGAAFFLWRKQTDRKPDFVVEGTLLDSSLSPDLQEKLHQELNGKKEK